MLEIHLIIKSHSVLENIQHELYCLVGNSGKSSVGNLLLGKEEFVVKERTSCTRRLGLVAGQWLTVVDTPGWWCDFSAQETTQLVKREILSSVSHCSPGPHVFLIAIKASSAFSEKRRRAVEEHVGLLGERVWSHCMVVLTSADRCDHTVHYIEGEGEPLQWLVERCGNRYHVLNNKTKGDGFQVRELIEKIEVMLAGCNSGWQYEIEKEVMKQLERKMRKEKERAKERRIKREKQRQMARSQLGELDKSKND
uniref:AIG1-type G domain-containing protein n=1 Tax=Mastacembelus armatus TaxID=205130 RepID=A0A7N8YKK3_9TELE